MCVIRFVRKRLGEAPVPGFDSAWLQIFPVRVLAPMLA